MDPYTAEKLVAYKHAELRAQARRAVPDKAWAPETTEHLVWIRALLAASGGLVRRTATQIWNGRVRPAQKA